ncbi:hypothetical protein [Treponema pedis]|uniref:hypothetical protein n=1 Tax=Treponema pedis TaxID=409322 RepID=UPI001CEFABFC|nr:hypothetical protein [Treponema pedis]
MDSAQFVPEYSYEDKTICYGITGGGAKYLSMIDPEKSLDENIVRLFFRTAGYLYDETGNLLTQEFSDITFPILHASTLPRHRFLHRLRFNKARSNPLLGIIL